MDVVFLSTMDILVRRIDAIRCQSESDCKSGALRLRSDLRRGLGHECPGYMNAASET